jgi:hypothetical protein
MFQEKALHREITSKQNVDNLSKGLLYVSISYAHTGTNHLCKQSINYT